MTDKSAAAVREFVQNWRADLMMHEGANYMISDLTALISEHYVAKEEVDKMVSERLRGELIAYDKWVINREGMGGGGINVEQDVDIYLKTREK